MKIVILSINGPEPTSLLENEGLETIRSLMVSGCYGPLEIPVGIDRNPLAAILEHVSNGGGRVARVDVSPPWDQARSVIEGGEWDALSVVAEADPAALDAGLLDLLRQLDDEVVVLIVSLGENHDARGAFVLASARSPLSGPIESTRLDDLPPTVLELAGVAGSAALPGRSLVSGLSSEPVTEDEEELVRERLRGLGYIA